MFPSMRLSKSVEAPILCAANIGDVLCALGGCLPTYKRRAKLAPFAMTPNLDPNSISTLLHSRRCHCQKMCQVCKQPLKSHQHLGFSGLNCSVVLILQYNIMTMCDEMRRVPEVNTTRGFLPAPPKNPLSQP